MWVGAAAAAWRKQVAGAPAGQGGAVVAGSCGVGDALRRVCQYQRLCVFFPVVWRFLAFYTAARLGK